MAFGFANMEVTSDLEKGGSSGGHGKQDKQEGGKTIETIISDHSFNQIFL